MEKLKIILTDLDGTLFRDDKSISDYSKDVICQAQKKGLLFGVCTSRAKVNALPFLEGINPDILITNGGGIASFRGEKIYSCEFSASEIKKLIQAAYEVCGNDVTLSVDNEKALYCNSKENLGDSFWTYNDFSDFDEPGMKMCVETLDSAKIEKIAGAVGINQIDFLPFSDSPWYKLSKKGAVKEKAIEQLCSHLKVSAQNIVSFGDDFSDIGMLKFCGKGIAMQNAIAEVKAAADEICLSNENDGVARWIEENL